MVARTKTKTWHAPEPARTRGAPLGAPVAGTARDSVRGQVELPAATVDQARLAPRQLAPGALQALQRTIGNQAIQRLLGPATGPSIQRDDDDGAARVEPPPVQHNLRPKGFTSA